MNVTNILSQLYLTLDSLQKNLGYVLLMVAALYAIHMLNWMTGHRLSYLGIYPRRIFGLIGIFFSTFIHSNFNHIFFNSIPFFILASFLLLSGFPVFICVTVIIIVLSGLGVWLIGRPGFHIGASGLIMGYWSYLLINAYYHESVTSIALACVCLYYLGGLAFQLVPTALRTSWEAHVFGFLAGIAAAYLTPIVLPIVLEHLYLIY